ncbi:hypothetical protein ACX5K5_13545 [Glutamicibacter bergerei]|nr:MULTISPECIES: hypothetical protein [Glutamicibacter]HBV09305.1 hypothetical protein [Micrococcaceae bacterium]
MRWDTDRIDGEARRLKSYAKPILVIDAAIAVGTAKTSNANAAQRLGWHQLPVLGGRRCPNDIGATMHF